MLVTARRHEPIAGVTGFDRQQEFSARFQHAMDQPEQLFGRTDVDQRVGGQYGIAATGRQPAQHGMYVAAPQVVVDAALLSLLQHGGGNIRSEEHTSELQSLMRISYAVF